jgi:hypothetical protein
MLVWDNFVSAQTLAVTAGDTLISVQPGQGAQFPPITPPDYSVAVIEDDLGNKEVIHIVSVAGDVLSVTRGEEGTLDSNFAANSRLELRPTTGFFRNFIDGGTYT